MRSTVAILRPTDLACVVDRRHPSLTNAGRHASSASKIVDERRAARHSAWSNEHFATKLCRSFQLRLARLEFSGARSLIFNREERRPRADAFSR